MPDIGELDRRVAIEYKVSTADSTYGSELVTWTNLATVWACWDDVPPSRSESVKLGLAVALNQTRVRIRYRSDVTSAMRFVYGGVNYNIIGGPATLGRNEFSEFVVERAT